MKPWKTLETVETEDGSLQLQQRGKRDFVITIDGRVLMSSMLHRSEVELSRWGCGTLGERPAPRVLTAGLGLGFTLYFIRNFAAILGENGQIPVVLAAWGPPVAAFLLPLGLLLHLEDG